MAKSSNQKTKLLHLYQLLLRQTDEDHPITVAQMIEALEQYGIKAERKSIYDDMEALRTFGLDVQSRKGKNPGWFVGARDFELPELKLLMDAVQSSRFITQKKSDTLIRKLEGLASVHQARQLQRQVYVSGRIKVMNESIYYNVDKLHTAISGQRAITFQYFDYDIHRKKVYRRDGKRYTVSPYGLIWNSENYYLVAYDHLHREMRHYRVDKMAEILVTSLPRQGQAQQFRNGHPHLAVAPHQGGGEDLVQGDVLQRPVARLLPGAEQVVALPGDLRLPAGAVHLLEQGHQVLGLFLL